jgi:hypothetical protein
MRETEQYKSELFARFPKIENWYNNASNYNLNLFNQLIKNCLNEPLEKTERFFNELFL